MKRRISQWLQPLHVALVALVVSFASGALAINITIQRANDKADAQATRISQQDAQIKLQDDQQEFLRIAFCGLVEPISLTTPATPTGQTYRDSAANTAHVLGCTPDPTDGK